MTPIDYAFSLRRVCLSGVPPPEDVAALGGDPRRWLRYRRMVRRRIHDVLEQAFARTGDWLGDEPFAELERRFLESGSLASPSLRDVPGEFVEWLRGARLGEPEIVPLAVLELSTLEGAERAVAMAPDDPAEDVAPLAMDAPAVLTCAMRLLALEHAVHRLEPCPGLDARREPTWLCVYRDPASLDVRILELSRVAHALLETLDRARVPLMSAVRAAAESVGVAEDADFVRALGELLGDLSERGVLRGSAAGVLRGAAATDPLPPR